VSSQAQHPRSHDGSTPYPPSARARLALVLLTLAYVLSFVDRQILSLLVEPMKRDLALTDVQVSLLQGLAFAVIYCLAGLPLGRAADQFNRRNIILIGVAFWSVMTSVCGVVRTYTALFFCRAAVGVGEATLSPSAYSMLSDYFPPRQLPAAMSFYNLGPAIGTGLAYTMGGVVLSIAGSSESVSLGFIHGLRPWQATFVIVGAFGFVVILLLMLAREPPRRLTPEDLDRSASFKDTLRFLAAHRSNLGTFFLGLSLLGVVSYATMTWYPTMFVRNFGAPVERVGLTFGPIYVIASMSGNLLGGWLAMRLADRRIRDPYVMWALIVTLAVTVGGVLVPLVPQLNASYAAAAATILFQSAWMGSAVAAVHLASPNRMRAQLTAILLFGTNIIGLVLGPSAVASITQYGFQDPLALRYSLMIVSLVAGLLAAFMIWFSWRRFPALTRASQPGPGTRKSTAVAIDPHRPFARPELR
jgi:MFS family permease